MHRVLKLRLLPQFFRTNATTRLLTTRTSSMDTVLDFWFTELTREQHFMKDLALDQLIKERYGSLLMATQRGEFDEYSRGSAQGALSTVIVLDQFTRNIFRDTPQMYDSDPKAIEVMSHALDQGFDRELDANQVRFLLMPLMHSEAISDQERGVQLFAEKTDEQTARFMVMHRDIVKKYGRFPHRNGLLGRESTPDEIEFLKTEGSSF